MTAQSLVLAMPPLKTHLGLHPLVVGVKSPYRPPSPLWMARAHPVLNLQLVSPGPKAAVEGKETEPVCLLSLQKNTNPYRKAGSSSLLFICAAFSFKGICSVAKRGESPPVREGKGFWFASQNIMPFFQDMWQNHSLGFAGLT